MSKVPRKVWARTAQLTRYGIDWHSLAVTLFQVDSRIDHDMSDCTAYVLASEHERVKAQRDNMLEGLEGLVELFAIREGSEVMQPLCTIEKDRVAFARTAIAAAEGKGDG